MEPATLFLIIFVIFIIWFLIGLVPLNIIRRDRPKDFKSKTRFVLYRFLISPIPILLVIIIWFVDYLKNTGFNKINDFFLER